MSIAKIQTGDRVKVISGSYRGTVGLVSALVKKNLPNGKIRVRVSVSEIPHIVDYRKNMRAYNMPGEMKTKARLIDISNVQLVTKEDQVSRSKVEIRDGKKIRLLKKTGEIVTKTTPTPTVKNQEIQEKTDTKAVKPKKEAKSSSKTTTKTKK